MVVNVRLDMFLFSWLMSMFDWRILWWLVLLLC